MNDAPRRPRCRTPITRKCRPRRFASGIGGVPGSHHPQYANIAADLAAWTRLLGCRDGPELQDADPDTRS